MSCNHNWIGDTCSRCGVAYHIHTEHAIGELKSELERVEQALPATYYAGLPLHDRVDMMVRHWRRLVEIAELYDKQQDELERVQNREVGLLEELEFWAGKKHEGDCEFSDKSDEGCWLCMKAERERWPQTQARINKAKGIL